MRRFRLTILADAKLVCLFTLCLIFIAAPVVSAQSDYYKNLEFPFYDPASNSCTSSTVSVPAGTLPVFIPEPYNGSFTQGANAHKVAPALVAAIFSEEHNLGNSETAPNTASLPLAWASFVKGHPDPNSAWASSKTPNDGTEVWADGEIGAGGPFQFEPTTWRGLGYQDSDRDNIVIASDAAAKYLASNGATTDKPENSWKNAIYDYNHADWYVNAVLTYYDYYNSQPAGSSNGSSTLDVNSLGCSSACLGMTSPSGQSLSQTRQQVVCLTQQELSLWQSQAEYPHPSYAATGFLKYSDNNYEEWCADFVSWVYNQAGYSFSGGGSGGWRLDGVSSIQALGEQNQSFHWHDSSSNYTPKPGDIAIHGSGHVNIYISSSNGLSEYIGGDQGDGPYGTQNPPSGSIVSTETESGYYSGGITGYVSPD